MNNNNNNYNNNNNNNNNNNLKIQQYKNMILYIQIQSENNKIIFEMIYHLSNK